MKQKIVVLMVGLLWLMAGCQTAAPAESQAITVFAAASLTDAFTELGQAFEAANPSVTVTFNFGGSSQLAAQLAEGVPADVFASANARQMEAAVASGRVEASAVQPFTTNQLVLIAPADNPAGLTQLEGLAKPNILLVTAVPGVPVRDYTDEIAAAVGADFAAALAANIVSEEENVRQIVAKVALGEADAGIVYTSDVTPDVRPNLTLIPIPAAQNIVAEYPIAPLADSANPTLAAQFVAFVQSTAGQAILVKWGFGAVLGN